MIKDPELLKLAVKGIEAEPHRWNQRQWNLTHRSDEIENNPLGAGEMVLAKGRWSEREVELQDLEHCGTTMCLAGHVITAAGYRPLAGYNGIGMCVDPETSELHGISMLAGNLLGLTETQRQDLFMAGYSDTVPQFKQRITRVTGVEFE